MRVPSTDGVDVAVHDLGGTGPPLLFSHATGFHGRCYEPVAAALTDRFHSYALDYRGHGATERPPDWQVDWGGYGDDAVAAARRVAPEGGLVGFGHSMGGAGLLLAAHRDPGRFDLVIAFEPIVFPPSGPEPPDHGSPLVVGARRRRRSFDSIEAALENYASKPPLGSFTPAALRAYVEHGFRPDPEGGVTLRCEPEHEARTFEQGSLHRTWDLLADITTPVLVVSGRVDEQAPAAIAALVAAELPNAEYVQLDQFDHFGPMTHPDVVAALIGDAVDGRVTR
ncbi:MAG: alpha/beta hydrolase [Ilumatobacteraceae bacterium]